MQLTWLPQSLIMERIKMNLYGASGHAKVIIDIVHSQNGRIGYVFDDNCNILEISGYDVHHNPGEGLSNELPTIIGIGENRTRKRVANSITGEIHPFLSHVSAVVSPSAVIGNGTVIMANASINAEASIGLHCIINTGAVVEHEVEMGNFVHISPNAAIAGNVEIGEGSHLGIGAVVIPGIKIGKWTTVGAGAVIIEDIPDFATVVGNPGKIIKCSEEIYE